MNSTPHLLPARFHARFACGRPSRVSSHEARAHSPSEHHHPREELREEPPPAHHLRHRARRHAQLLARAAAAALLRQEFGATPAVTGPHLLGVPAHAGDRGADSGPAVRRVGPQAGAACSRSPAPRARSSMLGLANSLWMLLASRMLDGITGGNISVAQAYMTDVTVREGPRPGVRADRRGVRARLHPRARDRWLLSQYGQMVAPFVAAALAIGNLLLVAFVLPESLSAGAPRAGQGRARQGLQHPGARQHARAAARGPLMTVRIVIGFTFAVFEGGFSLWAANALGLTAHAERLLPRLRGRHLGHHPARADQAR